MAAAVLALPATLTMAQGRATLAALDARLDASDVGAVAVVDASALTTLDTVALAVLTDLRRRAQARGASLEVARAPAKLLDLARLYGVEGLWRWVDVADAPNTASRTVS